MFGRAEQAAERHLQVEDMEVTGTIELLKDWQGDGVERDVIQDHRAPKGSASG
jgi:hypothetical protein